MGRQPSTGTKSSGLRRGAWSSEEDTLLRQCVEKYGEGSWHRVPSRAGLNRCRKSCRLRWLNYLHPDIKRGEFEDDEVDLIKKLHKLLGNRWSLIAGRIPGRTANDIKNYWNTHFKEKMPSNDVFPNVVKAIRPQPCSFFSNSTPSKHSMPEKNVGQQEQGSHSDKNTAKIPVTELSSTSCMEEPLKRIEEGAPSSRAREVEELMKMSTNEQQSTQLVPTSTAEGLAEKLDDHSSTASWMMEESLFNVDDLLADGDVWGYLLEVENYTCNEK